MSSLRARPVKQLAAPAKQSQQGKQTQQTTKPKEAVSLPSGKPIDTKPTDTTQTTKQHTTGEEVQEVRYEMCECSVQELINDELGCFYFRCAWFFSFCACCCWCVLGVGWSLLLLLVVVVVVGCVFVVVVDGI